MSNANNSLAQDLIHDGSKSFIKDTRTGQLVEVERSCDMCRKRKKKCSKTSPCTTCVKFNLECVYKAKEEKTPLTRARMTSLETSIGKVSKILKTIVDDKNVLAGILKTYGLKNEDLDSFEENAEGLKTLDLGRADIIKSQQSLNVSSTVMDKGESIASTTNSNDRSEELKLLKQIKGKVKKIKRNGIKGQERIQISDTIQSDIPSDELNGFNWIEIDDYNFKHKNDGMAALSVNPNNKGYFGQGSSANMLRTTLLVSQHKTESTEPASSEVIRVTRELASELRTFEVRESLVNSYFEHYHSSYPFLDKEWFLRKFMSTKNCAECNNSCRQLDDLLSKEHIDSDELKNAIEDEDWKILLNTVCALGAWCLQNEVTAMANMDLFYYKEAKNLIKGVLFERGSIPLVTAFTLMSNYTQKRDKPNTGWNYLGIASRMAIGLGLYKELGIETNSSSNSAVLQQKDLNLEIRRRLWWGLYIFDVGTAITFGRPVNFPSNANFDIRLPKNLDDCGCELTDTPTIYSGLIEQTKFTSISLDIHSKLLSSQPPSSKECLNLNEKIEQFVADLPKWFNKDNKIALPSCENIFIDDPETVSSNLSEQINSTKSPSDEILGNFSGEKTTVSKKLKTIPEWFYLTKYRLIWRVLNLQIIMLQNFVWQDIMGRNESRYINYVRTHPSMKKCINVCLDRCAESIESVKEFVDSILKNKKYDPKRNQLVESDSQHFVTSPSTLMEVLGDAAKRPKSFTPTSIPKSNSNSSLKQLSGLKSTFNKSKDLPINSSHAFLSSSDYSNTTGSTSPELSTKPHISMLASWYATYFLFQATIVPMICLIYNDENCNLHQWNAWKKQVNTAKECFAMLSESNKTASTFLKIIEDMCGNILKQDSVAPFSPAANKANNEPIPLVKESSPYALGSVYDNNNIFDVNGKLKVENSNFAIGTPFDKDLKMNLASANNSYFGNRGTPSSINNFSLTTPFISKGTTSDIRASNSRPATPSMINLLANDQQQQSQIVNPGSFKKSAENNIFDSKENKEQFVASPINAFDLMNIETAGKVDIQEEIEDDNLFGFGRGMGLEALTTHGSNTNLNSLLSIFGEAGVSSFLETNGVKGSPSTTGNTQFNSNKNKLNKKPSTLLKKSSSINDPFVQQNAKDDENIFSETADGLVIPELAHSQFPRRLSKQR